MLVSGGQPTLVAVILCYMTDNSEEEDRSKRFLIFEIIIFLGVVLATASSSFLMQLTSATAVFGISLICMFAGTLIVIFFVEDSIEPKSGVGIVVQLKDLFSPVRVKELYTACTQKRPFKRRRIFWCLTIMLIAVHFTSSGATTVFYLFTRHKFGWTLQDVTLFESASMLITVVGSAIALGVLKKMFHFSDLNLAHLSIISIILDSLIKTAASQSWQLYVASAFALFKLVSGATLRSVMSTIVSRDEVGKIYSITSAVEAISALGAAPLYSATYAATLSSFPSAFNLITAGVFMSTLILAVFISRWLSSSTEDDCNTQDTKL